MRDTFVHKFTPYLIFCRAFLGLARLGRTQLDSAFVFKRFEEESTVYEVTPRKPAKCFDNPMYNVETSDTAVSKIVSSESRNYKNNLYHYNLLLPSISFGNTVMSTYS